MANQTKKETMLKDEDVCRWIENIARGSLNTAETSIRRLSIFCEQNKLSPKALIDLAKTDKKKIENLLLDNVSRMEREGKAPGYISNMIKGIKSWLRYNDIECRTKIKITNSGATPNIENERVPTQEELKSALCYASERARVIISFVAMSGLRLETLGNSSGTDGLTIKDLPELKIDNNHVTFIHTPTMVVVRPTLSKARHRYFTFLTREGCEYLQAYLDKRMAQGEELTSSSPVIAVVPGYELTGKGKRKTGSKFIVTRNISREIRSVLRPRFTWRPYVLRAYFDSQMLLSENQGRISASYRSFFMGHHGDIEARYTTNKGCLSENMIQDMRKRFEESEEYISTVSAKAEINREKIQIESLLTFARVSGLSQEKIDSIRSAIMKSDKPNLEKAIDLLKSHSANLGASFTLNKKSIDLSSSSLSAKGKPYQSALVDQKEIVKYIEEGWEILRELKDGKFLVKRTNHVL